MIRIPTRLLVVFVAALLVLVSATFRLVSAQGPTPGGVVALVGGRVIDGTGRAPLEQATVLMSNGRIEAVGSPSAVMVPAGATSVDMSGKTLVPGLINAHAHLNVERGSTLTVRDDLLRRLRTYAAYGVTTTVSLGSTEADEQEGIRLRDEQERGVLDRARLYTGGVNAVGKTPDEARKDVDRLAALKVDIIKFHINGNPNDMTPETWGAIIDQARTRGLRTAVHIFYLRDAKAAVAKGVDILAHAIRDQDVDQAFVVELKRRNIGYIPTITRDLSVFVYETTPAFFADPFFLRGGALYREQMGRLTTPANQERIRNDTQAQGIKTAMRQGMKNLKVLSDGGVPIAMGTDSGAGGNPGRWQGYFEHTELEMMVQAGLTPMQALVAATGGAARIMKLDSQLGTLEPGKRADLLVLNANPLVDIRNTQRIDSVWLAGRRLAIE